MEHNDIYETQESHDPAILNPCPPFDTPSMVTQMALSCLQAVANDKDNKFSARAEAIIEEWRNSRASDELIERVPTTDDLMVDRGALVSVGEDGAWVEAWVFVAK